MIKMIITNVGNFGGFKDIQKYMQYEKLNSIDIISIQAWSDIKPNCRNMIYSYEEICKLLEV